MCILNFLLSRIRPVAGILLLMVALPGCFPSSHCYVHIIGLSQLNSGSSTDEVDHPVCWDQATFPAPAQTPKAHFTSLSSINDVPSEACAPKTAEHTTGDLKPQTASSIIPSTIKNTESNPASKKARSLYSNYND